MILLSITVDFGRLIRRYVKENPSIPFILICMGLLVAAVTFLHLNNGSFAKKLTEYAYYNLVVGVLLQCVVIIVEGKRCLSILIYYLGVVVLMFVNVKRVFEEDI